LNPSIHLENLGKNLTLGWNCTPKNQKKLTSALLLGPYGPYELSPQYPYPSLTLQKPELGSCVGRSLSNCFKPRHFWPMVLEAAPTARPYTIGIFRWKAFQELCMDPAELIRRFPAELLTSRIWVL